MNTGKYLPIGTTVLLKNVENHPVTIVGFLATTDDSNEIFDYCSYLYPYGLTEKAIYFNHDQIDKVIQLGYKSNNYNDFNTSLIDLKNNINEEKGVA